MEDEGPEDTAPGKRPGFLDTCHALASDSEVVRVNWPQFYESKTDGKTR